MVTASLREFVTINLTAGHSIILYYFLFQVFQQFPLLHITDLWLKAVVMATLVFVEFFQNNLGAAFRKLQPGGLLFCSVGELTHKRK